MEIKFISYDGSEYALCAGTLTVEIDGREFKITGLISGGSCGFDEEGNEEVTEGPWSIGDWPEDFPENAKDTVIALVNENVTHGCCGGCI